MGYNHWSSLAESLFPEFGLYHSVHPFIYQSAEEPKLTAGDAIDDIADIACELEEFIQRWDVSEEDAIWHLDFGFRNHWGTHLRELQLYLHKLEAEG